jgi:segregation and condensation protein B
MEASQLSRIIEAALLAAGQPLNLIQIQALFADAEQPTATDVASALELLKTSCAERGIEVREIASGYRLQVREELMPWVSRLWAEKPQRYSRALLETLALIAYRQPITRGEIEEIRGVQVNPNIIRTLTEREWIRTVGHRDVPGRPALFATTRAFLDYFNLKSLDELPTLAEIRDIDTLEPQFKFEELPDAGPAGNPQDAEARPEQEALERDL